LDEGSSQEEIDKLMNNKEENKAQPVLNDKYIIEIVHHRG